MCPSGFRTWPRLLAPSSRTLQACVRGRVWVPRCCMRRASLTRSFRTLSVTSFSARSAICSCWAFTYASLAAARPTYCPVVGGRPLPLLDGVLEAALPAEHAVSSPELHSVLEPFFLFLRLLVNDERPELAVAILSSDRTFTTSLSFTDPPRRSLFSPSFIDLTSFSPSFADTLPPSFTDLI
uniref:Uncharacterized protein n=1 Tax=Bombyx mori TaxID=7091 RepID=A0A8R2R086_BOMMO|nr:uncharacterized protein LOC119629714 [Bombyx mori]